MNNLKLYRKKLNLGLKELSDYVGVSERHLSFIENGRRMPSLPVAKKIADFLQCTIEDIFFNESIERAENEKYS